MNKIILIAFLLSCYEKNIQRLSNLLKNGNTSINDRIEYKVNRKLNINNLYNFEADLIYIKDLNKKKLVVKDKDRKTIIILEGNKITFKEPNIVLHASNSTTELIYNIFLYSSLEELDRILNILNIRENEREQINSKLIKVSFKEGYLIYDMINKVIKELSNIMYDNGFKFENKIFFDYKTVNRMLLLKKFNLESKTGNNMLIVEEELEE